MKLKAVIPAVCAALLLLLCIAAPVSAASVYAGQNDASMSIPFDGTTLAITDYKFDRELPIFEPNEESTITVTITNNGVSTVKLENIYVKYYENDEGIIATKADWRNIPLNIPAGQSVVVPVPLKIGEHTGNFYATLCVQASKRVVYDLKQPFVISVKELGADLELTNIKVSKTGNYHTLTADLHNLGYTTAKSLHITSKEGGDVGPYVTYPVGNLDPDDLAGFELTFNPPENGILTLLITYKDSSLNIITEEKQVNLANHMIVEETDYTMTIVIIVIAAIAAGLIIFAIVRKVVKSKGKKQ